MQRADPTGGPTGGSRHAYGDHPSQYGELAVPEGTPQGVAVVVHGGFWKAQYGIEYGRPVADALLANGWTVWNIEYRRVGDGGGVPATLDDVQAAIAHLDRLDVGVEVATVPVLGVGHSAGGHLVTWAGAGGRLSHVISQAGVLDLRAAADAGLGGGAVEAFLGHPAGEADREVDPIRGVPLAVPVWCVHGREDGTVPISQSADYVAAATAAGGRARLVEVDGDHFAVIDPATAAGAATLEIAAEILQEHAASTGSG
ncbi:alpha/beta hydrolase family protein [Nocardioides sambongensis]|uniref:alpha/beta hydrolase family protein n=1 Tax=Nocardioides sambongensis TaxID=2589074 RepID=UPI001E47B0CB|nr:alpha/beta hydrolase [Nocardioides sambongensis]